MTIKKQLRRHLGRKATRRLYKTMPWLNGAIALLAVGTILRRSEFGDLFKDLPEFIPGRKGHMDEIVARH